MRQQLAELEMIYDNAPVGLCLMDTDLRYLRINRWLSEINGVTAEDHVGRRLREIVPEIAESMESIYQRVIDTGEPVLDVLATGTTSADPGKIRHFLANYHPLKKEDGSVWRLLSIVRDVTQSRQAEEESRRLNEELEERVKERTRELRASEVRYRDFVERSPDAIWRMSREGVVTFISPAIKAISGFEPAEIVGLSFEEFRNRFLVGGSADDAKETYDRRMRGEFGTGEIVYELEYRRKDGSLYTAELRSIPVLNDEGEITEIHGITRDVSERKKAEAERAALEDQLRQSQKMDAIGQLAGGVAHDFNNLLTAIIGTSGMLLDDFNPSDPVYQDLLEIRKAGDRAASLTRQLLAFSRRQILQPEVLDLDDIVAAMQSMLRRLIGEHIDLLVDQDSEIPQVKVDPGQLEQVIMNLVINARDAMPKGGTIRIKTETVTMRGGEDASTAGVPPGPYVCLSVADTGCGMKEEVRSRVFEPFFTTKAEGKGTGLGLSTVFGIVAQSGGAIEVESEPGEGSTFRVLLPEACDSEVAAKKEKNRDGEVGGQETILLVEDEESIRNLLKRILERLGYTVLAAAQGGEALLTSEKFEDSIDLLITDVVMPQMNGIELAERLRPTRPQMRVLYVSGYNEEMVVDQGLVDSDMNFLQKPFTMDTIDQKVREVLEMQAGQ